MPVDLIQGYAKDRIEENLKEKRGGTGYKPTWWDKTLSGFVGVDAQQVADDAYITDQNQAANSLLTKQGLDRSTVGATPGKKYTADEMQGLINTHNKSEKDNDRKQGLTDQLTLIDKTNAPQIEEMRATNARLLQQGNNQMQLGLAQLTQSNNQFMAQMADSKDQRAMELQMRREELDRIDARDERNRRRDSIAALTSGLAALGAAFAL